MTVGRSPTGTVWNVQILRFVAASMVLFGHLNHETLQRPALKASGFTPFAPVWWPGGVDIFFVISGFIMYHISSGQFGRPGAPLRFAARRLVRLVPPYWFFTTLVLVAMAVVPSQLALDTATLPQTVASYLFIPAYNPQGVIFPVLILGWSLNFEMLFYAVFALGLMRPGAQGRMLIVALLLAIAACAAAGFRAAPLRFWCDPLVIEFLFGIGIAALYERGVRLSVPVAIAIVVAGVALMIAMTSAGIAATAYHWRFLWAGLPALLICLGGVLIRDDGACGAFRRALVFGGDTSYALYLSHPFTLSVVALLCQRAGVENAVVFLAVGFVACVSAAAVIYVLLERPVYTALNRRLRKHWAAVDDRCARIERRPAIERT